MSEESKGFGIDKIFAIILVVVALLGLVYLARLASQDLPGDIAKLREGATGTDTMDDDERGEQDITEEAGSLSAIDQKNWTHYRDAAWGYELRFPASHQARLLDSRELSSPLPGEVILSGIVIAPRDASGEHRLPAYPDPSLTLLVSEWPGYGYSETYLNEVYRNGSIPPSQIKRTVIGGRPALSFENRSGLAGATAHTEILIAGPGARIVKLIYWPAGDGTLETIAETVTLE